MEKISISAFLVINLFATALFAQGKMEVTVTNIQELKGTIRVAVYSSENDFMKKSFLSQNAKVTGKEVTVIFENVKPGEYAISTYHDVDNNNQLNTGFMGIPKEPYGFSNDARNAFGPPTYADAKFKMDGNVKTSIKVE